MLECCENVGGRVIMTINGRRYKTRGGFTVRPTTFTREVDANDDGSLAVKTKSVPAEAEMRFTDACDFDPSELMGHCTLDVTLDWIDARKKYLFTRAIVVGRPEISSESGEVSGLKVASSFVEMFRY
jgi:hypothetical protein